MHNVSTELASPTSLVLIAPFIAALAPGGDIVTCPVGSLPSPCLLAPQVLTIVCGTSINAMPMFRAEAIVTAKRHTVDVLLVRHGQYPEALDDVSVDLVVARGGVIRLLWDMLSFRDVDQSFWLVPPTSELGPYARLDASGVFLSVAPPYNNIDERADGVVRAARETVLNLRRFRRGESRGQ